MSGLNAPAQPLDPRGDVNPIGLARELGDLFGAKVLQARKLNGSHAVRPAPGSRWDEKVEQVEAPVAPMLLVDLPDDLLVQILASLTGSARAHRHKKTPHECDLHHIKLLHGHISNSMRSHSQKEERSLKFARAAMCLRPARGRPPRSSLTATAGAYYPWPAARRCSICRGSSKTRRWCAQSCAR